MTTLTPSQRLIWREVTVTLVIVIGILSGLHQLRDISIVHDTLTLTTGVLLVYVPLFRYWRSGTPIGTLDHSPRDALRAVLVTVLFTLAIGLPLLAGNHVYQTLLGRHFTSIPPVGALLLIFGKQILFTAFPEEFFFRAYVQGRLNTIYPKTWRILGASCGRAWIYTALLFAVSHSAITIRWWHAFIVVPGLAFGWLRERTGTIIAPILFHALSNTFAYFVFRAYTG